MASDIGGVSEWIQTLAPEQVALLQRHLDDAELPPPVMQLLQDSPVSPMLVSEGGGDATASMPPAIRQALMASPSQAMNPGDQ